jgi:hypothetical protein
MDKLFHYFPTYASETYGEFSTHVLLPFLKNGNTEPSLVTKLESLVEIPSGLKSEVDEEEMMEDGYDIDGRSVLDTNSLQLIE